MIKIARGVLWLYALTLIAVLAIARPVPARTDPPTTGLALLESLGYGQMLFGRLDVYKDTFSRSEKLYHLRMYIGTASFYYFIRCSVGSDLKAQCRVLSRIEPIGEKDTAHGPDIFTRTKLENTWTIKTAILLTMSLALSAGVLDRRGWHRE